METPKCALAESRRCGSAEFEVWHHPINTPRRLPRLPRADRRRRGSAATVLRAGGVPQIRISVKRGLIFELRQAKIYVLTCVRDYVSTCRCKKVQFALPWL
jgi:hypothetical protein